MSFDGWSPVDMGGTPVFVAKNITSNYTPTESTELLLVDCTAGEVIITLPETISSGAVEYRISKIDSTANFVRINRSGADTIMGVTQIIIQDQWGSADLVASSGTYTAVGGL